MGSDGDSLAVARRLLEGELGSVFEPIDETNLPEADLKSSDGMHIAEVKRVTSQSLRALGAATSKYETNRDVVNLRWRWLITLDAQTNSDTLPPTPSFKSPSAVEQEDLEAVGFTVQSKAERELAFRNQPRGPKQPLPKVKGLIDILLPHLQVLESHGISEVSRNWSPWSKCDEVSTAQRAILSAIHGGLVMSFEPESVTPGVELILAYGYILTGRPETIVGRVQTWLDSEKSVNLRQSLERVPEGVRRHAVLVFDAASEPEFDVIAASFDGALPVTELRLPHEVDSLWAIFGDRALSYSSESRWRSHTIEAAEVGD